MEFLGTKGKWEFLNTDLADFILTTVICENQVVCHVNSVKENRVANAQLIAHAPEMFNLLKSIHFDYTNGHIEDLEDLEEKIIQIQFLLKSATAISKANEIYNKKN